MKKLSALSDSGQKRSGNHSGFTLLELLVTLGIISVLSAIAIPRYNDYRKKAYDMRAQVDLRNVALAEEAFYLDNEAYLDCQDSACHALPGVARLSVGTTLEIVSTATGFTGTSTHPKGSSKVFQWDTSLGGLRP